MNDRPEPVTTLRDVLDDAADLSMAGRGLDPAAVVARAGRPEYRPVVGRGAPPWRGRPVLGPRLLVAAAVLLVLLTLATTFLPRVLAESPLPAQTPPTEPGLPRTLRLAPVWTPSITEAPIGRAAYVVTGARPSGLDGPLGIGDGADWTPSADVWLVGADDGALRALPVTTSSVDLSADGRRVAWSGVLTDPEAGTDRGTLVEGSPPTDRVTVLDVTTGTAREYALPAPDRAELRVDGVRFDPTGSVLAVWGLVVRSDSSASFVVAVLDVTTGAVRPLCAPEVTDPVSDWRGPGLLAAQDCTALTTAEAATWPAVDPAAAARLDVRVVPMVPPPASALEFALPMAVGDTAPFARVTRDGVRWMVTDDAPGEPADNDLVDGDLPTSADAFLVTSAGARTALGTVGGVLGLATVGDAAVVARWTPRAEDSAFGPSDVLRVPLDGGEVEVLGRGDGQQVRPVAVAADAVASGRFFDAPVVETYGDRAWWRYNLELVDLTRLWFLAALVGGTIAVVRVRLWWQLRRRRP